MEKSKVGIILLAKMSSSRLPNKHALKIKGKILLSYLLERLKKCNTVDEIILAVTQDKKDDFFIDFAKKNNIKLFRGKETLENRNLLESFKECAEKNNLDIIVRITGDSPFIEPEQIDRLVSEFKKSDFEYIALKTRDNKPVILSGWGLAVEVMSLETLKKAIAMNPNKVELEHVTPFIYKNPDKFNIKFLDYPKLREFNHDDLRLTFDFPEDFEIIKEIIEKLYKGEAIELEEVIKFLKERPHILKKMKEINNANTKKV